MEMAEVKISGSGSPIQRSLEALNESQHILMDSLLRLEHDLEAVLRPLDGLKSNGHPVRERDEEPEPASDISPIQTRILAAARWAERMHEKLAEFKERLEI